MGTNYYLKSKPCYACGHSKNEKHIGKSSFGWQFHFRGYPEDSLVSFDDWMREFADENKVIVDEYGQNVKLQELIDLIESKKDGLNHYNVICGHPMTKKEREYCKERQHITPYYDEKDKWKDDKGYAFSGYEFC
jgi:hypothetical protein